MSTQEKNSSYFVAKYYAGIMVFATHKKWWVVTRVPHRKIT
jgi:hypothetical protein